MPHATNALGESNHGLVDSSEKAKLELLLKTKLHGVPAFHLPTLTVADILDQTPRALAIPNIPSDIQLPFFLRNRATIDRYAGKPVKDEEKQSLDMTRAIWFYRLDEAHQFQRFHDVMRWNTAIFVALLALHSKSSDEKYSSDGEIRAADCRRGTMDSYRPGRPATSYGGSSSKGSYKPITPAAIRFIKQYIAAVIEHHNTPTSSFTARESFVRAWKSGPWDLFTVFGGAQKKLLKNAMKTLGKRWEAELGVAEKQMGRERYQRDVGKFVGGLVPGRRDQGVHVIQAFVQDKSGGVKVDGNTDMENLALTGKREGEEAGGNTLLEALLSPYVPQTKQARKQDEAGVKSGTTEVEGTPVTDLRCAIAALQNMEPRDILPVLIRLFPE
jgi:hypothetical protein